MSDKTFSQFSALPEFMTATDLVGLGLFPSQDAVYLARLRGQSPDYIKLKRKILYPKASVLEFVEQHMRKGDRSDALVSMATQAEQQEVKW